MPRRPAAPGQLDEVVPGLVVLGICERLLDALAARDDGPRAGRQDRPAEHRRTDVVERVSDAAGDDVDRADRVEVRRHVAAGPRRAPAPTRRPRCSRASRAAEHPRRSRRPRGVPSPRDDLEPHLRTRGRQARSRMSLVVGRSASTGEPSTVTATTVPETRNAHLRGIRRHRRERHAMRRRGRGCAGSARAGWRRTPRRRGGPAGRARTGPGRTPTPSRWPAARLAVVERLRRALPHPPPHGVGRAGRDRVRVHPFTAPEVMPATICRWKRMYMISGGIVMSSTSAKSRLYGAHRLRDVVERGQLHGGVLVAGQEVQRVREVVEDEHGLHHDHRHDHRPQQREDHAEEQLDRPGAVDDRGLVELARDRRDEGTEQQDAEREAERHVHRDEARRAS